jgi:hypothetical protein
MSAPSTPWLAEADVDLEDLIAIVAEVTDLADCPHAAPHAGEVAWFGGFLLIAAAAYSANAQPGEEDGQARPGVKEQGPAALHSGQAWAPGRRRRSAHRSRAAGVPEPGNSARPGGKPRKVITGRFTFCGQFVGKLVATDRHQLTRVDTRTRLDLHVCPLRPTVLLV